MKKITLILLMFGTAVGALADEANWLTSFSQAADQASKENKLLLLDFTGSDWCGWCMKLDAEAFSSPQFIDYARNNLVLMRVDFPRSKPQSDELKQANRALKAKYSVEGYPTVVVAKPDGTTLWQQTGYVPGGAKVIIDAANQCRKAVGLAAPTTPPVTVAAAPIQPPSPPPPKPGGAPKLQGILYSATHSSAVLDGKTCEEGDTVHGAHIIKIERQTVTVEFQGQVKVLEMN